MHLEDCCGTHVGGDQGLDWEAGVWGAEMRRKRGDTCSRPAVRQEPLPGRRCRMNLFRAGGAGYMRDGRRVTPGLSDVGVEKGGRQETGSRSRGFLDAILFFFSWVQFQTS